MQATYPTLLKSKQKIKRRCIQRQRPKEMGRHYKQPLNRFSMQNQVHWLSPSGPTESRMSMQQPLIPSAVVELGRPSYATFLAGFPAQIS